MKRIMKNKICIIFLLFIVAILLTTCNKDPVKTYYKIKGYGYAFDTLNNKPLSNAKLMVITRTDGQTGVFEDEPAEDETYYTDANGYYEICFMKRYGTLKIVNYIFQLYYNAKGHEYIYEFSLDVDSVKNAEKNIFFAPILTPY